MLFTNLIGDYPPVTYLTVICSKQGYKLSTERFKAMGFMFE